MKEKLSLEEELNALKSDSVSTKFVLVSWAKLCELAISKLPPAPGGRGSPPSCEPYRNVPLLKVWFCAFLVWNRVWFLGSYGNVGMYLLFQFQLNKKWKSNKRFQHGF